MREWEPGCLARSLAGHDKGRLYIILEAAGEYVSLTDGKIRLIVQPKRINKKHVQLQDPKDHTLKHKLKQEKTVTDEEIRRFLDSQKQVSQQGGIISNVESRCN